MWWFDVPLLRYTAEVNGFDSLIMTKLDVLDDLDTIPVCVAYEVDGKVITTMPASTRRMEAIKPLLRASSRMEDVFARDDVAICIAG